MSRDDFIISDCNKLAAEWIDRWPDWPGQFPVLNIVGPAASGKSHLAAVWQAASNAEILQPDGAGDAPASNIILDHPQFGDSAGEEGLFHCLNALNACGRSMLILSRTPVARMDWQLADLASRMRAVNLVQLDGSSKLPAVDGSALTGIASGLPRGYLSGLELSNGTDADHDINISAGECRGIDDDEDITLAAFTKQIDASWAAGTNQGGLASGVSLANNTWYFVFAIKVGGAADVGFDTSVTGGTLVSAHSATAVRRIGCIKTDGSANILGFHQNGDQFEWDVYLQDVNASNPGTSAVTATITTPLGLKVRADLYGSMRDTSPSLGKHAVVFSPHLSTHPAESAQVSTETDGEISNYQTTVLTNTSSQVKYRLTSSTGDQNFKIITRGWFDTRGRDD